MGCATRKTTPQAPCTELHGRYRTPKQLARNAKNPGKTKVFERREQELNFWVFSQCFRRVRKARRTVGHPKVSLILEVFLSGSSQPCFMFLSGVHHTKNKNLKLSNVVEDDEWKSGNRLVPQTVINRRTPIGICCQFERRGFHAFKNSTPNPTLCRSYQFAADTTSV